jgi:hypothetical protein
MLSSFFTLLIVVYGPMIPVGDAAGTVWEKETPAGTVQVWRHDDRNGGWDVEEIE